MQKNIVMMIVDIQFRYINNFKDQLMHQIWFEFREARVRERTRRGEPNREPRVRRGAGWYGEIVCRRCGVVVLIFLNKSKNLVFLFRDDVIFLEWWNKADMYKAEICKPIRRAVLDSLLSPWVAWHQSMRSPVMLRLLCLVNSSHPSNTIRCSP